MDNQSNVFDCFRAVVAAGYLARMTELDVKVYLALLKYADTSTGEAWPSMETVAKDTGTANIGRARRSRSRLVELGLIEVVERGGGRNKSCVVRILMPKETGTRTVPVSEPQTGTDSVPVSDEKQGRCATETGTLNDVNRDAQRTETGTLSVPRTTQELPKEQPKEQPKGRAKKKEEPMPSLPEGLNTPEFGRLFADFVKHRREIGKPLKTTQAEKLLARCDREGIGRATECMELSIENGWQGLIWERVKESKNGNHRKPTAAERGHFPEEQIQFRSLIGGGGTNPRPVGAGGAGERRTA